MDDLDPKKNIPKKSEEKEEESTNLIKIPRLRTYKQDVRDAVQGQNLSSARILLLEQQKKVRGILLKEETTLKSPRNKFLFALALILIIGAGGIFGYGFFKKNLDPIEPSSRIIIERPEFIEVQGQSKVTVDLKNKRDILNAVETILLAPILEEAIEEILIVSEKDTFINGEIIKESNTITSKNLFELLEARASDSLIRSLNKDFMLGVYGVGVSEPFIMFKVNDFENAFASMLEWEPLMARDLQPIFFTDLEASQLSKNPLIGVPNVPSATTTGTVAGEIRFDPTIFTDTILQNKDTRVIKNEFNEIVLFYTFIDDNHLLIASKEKTLTEIIRRLRGARLIR